MGTRRQKQPGRLLAMTDQRDYGDECDRCDQLQLDLPKQCVCGATRPNLCAHDADLRWAAEAPARRPKTCLRRVDPATSEWPAGY